MKPLVPLLVLAGLVTLAMGTLKVVEKDEACEDTFTCEEESAVANALAGMTWFAITFILWVMALILVWMRRKFDDLPF